MDQQDFLSAVLPTQGRYCTFISKGQVKKNIFVDTLDNLYNTNVKHSDGGAQAYYALSTFDDNGTREAVHACFTRAIFVDIDCGVDEKTGKLKAYPTKKAAVTALAEFLEKSSLNTLGMPWLVDSGGGVHVYWPLDEDAAIEAWKPVAEAFKRAAVALSFKIDMTVTADAARVLRCPGTLNWKYAPPKPVLLKQRGGVFALTDIAEKLAGYAVSVRKVGTALALPGIRPAFAALGPVAKALAGNSITLFKNIMVRTVAGTGCAQVQFYVDHASEDGMEPLWRGMLSIAKPCDDGDKAMRRLSAMHPYDEERMLVKAAEIRGPYPCSKLDSENPGVCGTCKHWGKITNPLALGRQVQMSETAVVYEEASAQGETVQLDRPKPPWGFSYGANGGVYYNKPKGDKPGDEARDILLLPYDFFMTQIFRDGAEVQAEFKAIKGTKIVTFAVPSSVCTSPAECLKTLAANNVISAHHSADLFLYQYVRQSVMNGSTSGEEVDVPPRFGWQEGGDFAVGSTVYSQHGPDHDYDYVSERLQNVIDITQCAGTIEEWRKPFYLMQQKGFYGHLAIGVMGFGSILMEFTPPGSRTMSMHICAPESSQGKSYALGMAASVWGNSRDYVMVPTTSTTTLMQRAGFFGSLPLCVDEVTNKQHDNPDYIPRMVFDFSAGMHKTKGSASGNAEIRNNLRWASYQILTSNAPALEAMMGARATTSEGGARRMLEWVIPKSIRFNWSDNDERKITVLLDTNYGMAGCAFIRWCIANKQTVSEVMQETIDMWRKHASATDDERFWTAGVCADVAAAILLGKGTKERPFSGILPGLPIRQIIDFWFDDVVVPARAVINANRRSAKDILDAYLRENNPHFVQAIGSTVMQGLTGQNFAISNDSNRRLVRGRVERNVTPGVEDVYIEARLLKQHCASLNYGYSAFIADLNGIYLVREGRKDLLAGTNGPGMRVQCVRITRNIRGDARVQPAQS